MDNKKKILIVEDEESIAELEKDYLEINGFEVVIETEGTSALKRTDEEEFDMFILDLMLPGIDVRISEKRVINQCLWCQQKKMILIK